MEKVLAVYEGDCAGRGRDYSHYITPKIITPPKALQRVGRGANNFVIFLILRYTITFTPVKLGYGPCDADKAASISHRIITDLVILGLAEHC